MAKSLVKKKYSSISTLRNSRNVDLSAPPVQPTPIAYLCLSAYLLSLPKNLLKKGVSNLINDLVTYWFRPRALLPDAQSLCGLPKHQAVSEEGLRLSAAPGTPRCVPKTQPSAWLRQPSLIGKVLQRRKRRRLSEFRSPYAAPPVTLWTPQHSLGCLLRPKNAVRIQSRTLPLQEKSSVGYSQPQANQKFPCTVCSLKLWLLLLTLFKTQKKPETPNSFGE